jgi:hypothetical protein
MPITKNTKVDRLLDTLALELKDLEKERVCRIHNIINDERDGYNFNFKMRVETWKCITNKVTERRKL